MTTDDQSSLILQDRVMNIIYYILHAVDESVVHSSAVTLMRFITLLLIYN